MEPPDRSDPPGKNRRRVTRPDMTRTPYYVALIEHDVGSLYGVRFPDLPG